MELYICVLFIIANHGKYTRTYPIQERDRRTLDHDGLHPLVCMCVCERVRETDTDAQNLKQTLRVDVGENELS